MNRVARALLIAAVLVAPTAAGAVELGEIVFTELMIAPAAGPEWIELYNPTTGDLDLQGCVLTEEDNEYVIDEPLVLESRDFALLARSSEDEDCTIYDDTGSCVRAPDLLYGSLSLNNGDPETLALTCDGELIDSVTYDWGEYEDDCDAAGTEACTVNLHPERQTAVDNDEWVANWCVPFEFAPTFDEDGNPVVATPWAVGACVVPGAPCGEGDAVITEFMIAPDTTSREWFEVKVTTGSGCDFQGCEIWEGLEPDPTVAFCESAAGDWDCHPVDVPGGRWKHGAPGPS